MIQWFNLFFLKVRVSKGSKGVLQERCCRSDCLPIIYVVFSRFLSQRFRRFSAKTLPSKVCNFEFVERGFQEGAKKEPHCWDSDSFCFESDSSSSGSFAGVSTFLIWFTVTSFVSGLLFCRVSRGLSEILILTFLWAAKRDSPPRQPISSHVPSAVQVVRIAP